jgi:hypothetical protein
VYVLNVSEACCKCFVQMLKVDRNVKWLYTYVESLCSYCFICFSRRMLQVCLFRCCICFTHMLHVYYMDVAYVFTMILAVFRYFSSVLDAYFKCFICLHIYVVSVASRCFKSRSGVVSPSSLLCCSSRCLLFLSAAVRHPPPLPSS